MPEKYTVNSSLIWNPEPKGKTGQSLIDYLQEYGDLLDKFIIKSRPGWEKIFKKQSWLPLVGPVIIDVAKWLHVNPDFILALMIHESGGGTSPIAKDKNNFFGWMAYDKSPYSSAGFFCSAQGCIAYVVFRIKIQYLSQTGKYFKGNTLKGLNANYSKDKEERNDLLTWGDKVCLLMNKIDRFLTENNFT